jgi:hypothetical protein
MRARLLVLALPCLVFAWRGACAQDTPAGLWTSEGYGLFFRIDSSRIVASEITSVSCLPARIASRIGDQGRGWVFQGGFASGEELVRIDPGANSSTATLRRSDDLAAMTLHRPPSPPPLCLRPVEDTPFANYEVFRTTFAENYPFFGCMASIGTP